MTDHPNTFWLDFSDPELAKLLASGTPPEGVTVSEPTCGMQCSNPAEIFSQVVINFAVGIPTSLIAAWIYDRLKQSPTKSSRVNRNQITFSEESIRRLIENELTNQKARDAQWAKEHQQPPEEDS